MYRLGKQLAPLARCNELPTWWFGPRGVTGLTCGSSDVCRADAGYTTDNGAFYYYNTEPGKNYEATILDLKAYAVREKIPFRWVLYDSWFYEKGGETGHGWDPLNGVINWTDADPSIFPSGLRYMYRETGW